MNNQDVNDNQRETFLVKTLEQARLLADEFKLGILMAFAEQATTVKQVAEALGEKPTRLYRHVDALLEAGLLRVVEERQKRGTVERTLQAVASRFEAEPSLFQGDKDNEGPALIRAQFSAAADAFVRSLTAEAQAQGALEPICLRIVNRVSSERLAELHRLLLDWAERAAEEEGATGSACDREFTALVALSEAPSPSTDSST